MRDNQKLLFFRKYSTCRLQQQLSNEIDRPFSLTGWTTFSWLVFVFCLVLLGIMIKEYCWRRVERFKIFLFGLLFKEAFRKWGPVMAVIDDFSYGNKMVFYKSEFGDSTSSTPLRSEHRHFEKVLCQENLWKCVCKHKTWLCFEWGTATTTEAPLTCSRANVNNQNKVRAVPTHPVRTCLICYPSVCKVEASATE